MVIITTLSVVGYPSIEHTWSSIPEFGIGGHAQHLTNSYPIFRYFESDTYFHRRLPVSSFQLNQYCGGVVRGNSFLLCWSAYLSVGLWYKTVIGLIISIRSTRVLINGQSLRLVYGHRDHRHGAFVVINPSHFGIKIISLRLRRSAHGQYLQYGPEQPLFWRAIARLRGIQAVPR